VKSRTGSVSRKPAPFTALSSVGLKQAQDFKTVV